MTRDVLELVRAALLLAVALPFGVLWAIALADLLQRADWEFPSWQPGSNVRMVWAAVVVVLGGFGALLYYYMVMRIYPRSRH